MCPEFVKCGLYVRLCDVWQRNVNAHEHEVKRDDAKPVGLPHRLQPYQKCGIDVGAAMHEFYFVDT